MHNTFWENGDEINGSSGALNLEDIPKQNGLVDKLWEHLSLHSH